MMRSALVTAGGLAAAVLPCFAQAQISQHGYALPLELATIAAQEAVHICAASGYPVTATVVDVSGVAQVVLRGDHSTIHTRDSSFRKAYTVVTMGPIFSQQTSGAFAEAVQHNASAAQLASLPNILALPGAVAIMANGEIVAGLGVGGSPGGDKDEVCAQAGVAKIRNELPR
jgi:uncharacterized protein GlcG (DUF336 family)